MNTGVKITVNDKTEVPSSWLGSAKPLEQNGDELRFDGFNIIGNVAPFEAYGVIKRTNTVKNLSDCDITVNRLSSVYADNIAPNFYRKDILIHLCRSAWQGEGQWIVHKPRELGLYPVSAHETCNDVYSVSSVGSWSTYHYYPILLIEDKTDGITYFFEHQGGASWEIMIGTAGNPDKPSLIVEVNSLNEKQSGTVCKLKPGESYTTLPVLYGEIKGTPEDALCGLIEYKRETQRKLCSPLVCFNDYMNCLWAMPTAEKLIPLIDAAAEVGAEVFCIDDGWFINGRESASFGDWIPDNSKFGEYGLAGIIKYISDKGMKPGIWTELETCSKDAALLKLDENAVLKRRGNILNEVRCFANFSCKAVTDYFTDRIRYLYALGVRYIKNDYNHSLGAGCDNNNTSSAGFGVIENYRAFCGLIDSLCEEMPDLIIENCGSGAMRSDSGTLAHFHLQSISDQENYLNLPSIVWGTERCIPPEKCGIWAYPYPLVYSDKSNINSAYGETYIAEMSDGEQTVFNMSCALFGVICLSGHIEKCDEYNTKLIKQAVECYKRDREFIENALPVKLYPQQELYRNGYTVLALKTKNKLRVGIFKNRADNKLSLDLSAYINTSSRLREIYPLKDTVPSAALNNGYLEFDIKAHIAARVFEIDI